MITLIYSALQFDNLRSLYLFFCPLVISTSFIALSFCIKLFSPCCIVLLREIEEFPLGGPGTGGKTSGRVGVSGLPGIEPVEGDGLLELEVTFSGILSGGRELSLKMIKVDIIIICMIMIRLGNA